MGVLIISLVIYSKLECKFLFEIVFVNGSGRASKASHIGSSSKKLLFRTLAEGDWINEFPGEFLPIKEDFTLLQIIMGLSSKIFEISRLS